MKQVCLYYMLILATSWILLDFKFIYKYIHLQPIIKLKIMQNSCQTTIMKKALATSREKYSELLQVHEKVFAHNEQLLLRNKELEDVVRKQEADKSAFVENMAILV